MSPHIVKVAFFCLLLSASFQLPSFCAPDAPQYDWKRKLNRGGLNLVSSPVEIAREIQITSSEKDLLQGWTVGLVKGFGQGLLRFGAGVVDVLTCPFNFPDERKAPLIQPEYVWEKSGVKYSS